MDFKIPDAKTTQEQSKTQEEKLNKIIIERMKYFIPKINNEIKQARDKIDNILNLTVKNDEDLEYELTSDDYDWLEKVGIAVKKQTPEKPIFVNETCNGIKNVYLCPCCKNYLPLRVNNILGVVETHNYCDECGQKIEKIKIDKF